MQCIISKFSLQKQVDKNYFSLCKNANIVSPTLLKSILVFVNVTSIIQGMYQEGTCIKLSMSIPANKIKQHSFPIRRLLVT